MTWSILADLVMLVHFAFVLFVAAGGLLVLVRPRLAWLHLPALVYGVAIDYLLLRTDQPSWRRGAV